MKIISILLLVILSFISLNLGLLVYSHYKTLNTFGVGVIHFLLADKGFVILFLINLIILSVSIFLTSRKEYITNIIICSAIIIFNLISPIIHLNG